MRLIEPMDAKSAISVLNMAVTYNGCGRATSDDLAEHSKWQKKPLKSRCRQDRRYHITNTLMLIRTKKDRITLRIVRVVSLITILVILNR